MLAVLFTHTAHQWAWLAAILQTDKLDGMNLVLQAQGLLMRFVCQRYLPVFSQSASGVCELRTLGT